MASAINNLFQAHRLNDKSYIHDCIKYIKKLNILQLYVVYTFADNTRTQASQNPLLYNYCITVMRYCWQLINSLNSRFAATLFRPLSCAQIHQQIIANGRKQVVPTVKSHTMYKSNSYINELKYERSWNDIEIVVKLEKV
jgi:hypothetical protein